MVSSNVCFSGECHDIIQVSGANAQNTPGGNAVADVKTIYAYTPDGSENGTEYEGSSWPYVTTDVDVTTIEVPANITASITKNSESQVLTINQIPIFW